MSFSRMFTYRVLTERCHTVVRRHTVYYCRSSPDIGHQQAFEVSFKWKLHITIVSHVLLFSTFVPHFSNTNTAACRILAEIFTVFCFCCPRSSWSGLTTSVHKFNFDHFQLWVTPFFFHHAVDCGTMVPLSATHTPHIWVLIPWLIKTLPVWANYVPRSYQELITGVMFGTQWLTVVLQRGDKMGVPRGFLEKL